MGRQKEMVVALTGHQYQRLASKESYVIKWMKRILEVIGEGQTDFVAICGGAAGSDELFGKVCADKKIPFKLYLPIEDYRGKELNYLKSKCQAMVVMADEWEKGLDTKRDKMMVDDCDILLAVWDGIPAGGTYQTIRYAAKQGKPVIFMPRTIFKREIL